jgi:chromosome partitioning protein
MSVLTFASTKGGAGKTTAAIVIGTTLAKKHHKVIFIDGDPAKRLFAWSERSKIPRNIEVWTSDGERCIHDEIDAAKEQADFVLIDLEGAATKLNGFAMSESDLVIVPMGDEQQDAEGAIETLAELKLVSRSARRSIPYKLLFTRTKSAVKSRLQTAVNQQMRYKLGHFETELKERTAYSSLHNLGGDLYTMSSAEVSNIAKAIGNAAALTEELLEILRYNARMNKDMSHA